MNPIHRTLGVVVALRTEADDVESGNPAPRLSDFVAVVVEAFISREVDQNHSSRFT